MASIGRGPSEPIVSIGREPIIALLDPIASLGHEGVAIVSGTYM